MSTAQIFGIVVIVLLAAGLAALVAAGWVRRRIEDEHAQKSIGPSVEEQVQTAMQRAAAELSAQAAQDQRQFLAQIVSVQEDRLGSATNEARQATAAELSAKKDVIDTRLDEVHREMRAELDRLGQMVKGFTETSAQRFGEVDRSLRVQAEITSTLSQSTQALREAMASSATRGQWGERMAEDVLRLAGFVENVNYRKQAQLEGATGRPDFTFTLPKGQELYMDVKFPMASYLRFQDATTDAERDAHRTAFLRDVRARVKELAKRDYTGESSRQSLDYVLLFLPNETLNGFIHENDPDLIDDAMKERVVMCSPLTLFAFLGVIRQAHDNFMIEQTSDEILGLIGKFGQQWGKYNDELDKVHNSFERLNKQFDQLVGTRKRGLDKPLAELESIRRERNLPIDGELFAELDIIGSVEDVEDATPPGVRRLGA